MTDSRGCCVRMCRGVIQTEFLQPHQKAILVKHRPQAGVCGRSRRVASSWSRSALRHEWGSVRPSVVAAVSASASASPTSPWTATPSRGGVCCIRRIQGRTWVIAGQGLQHGVVLDRHCFQRFLFLFFCALPCGAGRGRRRRAGWSSAGMEARFDTKWTPPAALPPTPSHRDREGGEHPPLPSSFTDKAELQGFCWTQQQSCKGNEQA